MGLAKVFSEFLRNLGEPRSGFENDAVSWTALFESVEGRVDIREGEFLDERGDLMSGAEVEHTRGGGGAAEGGSRKGPLAHDERKCAERDGFGNGPHCVEAAFRGECGDVAHPVERNGDGANYKIEAVGFGFHSFRVAGVHNTVGAEFFEFLGFVER